MTDTERFLRPIVITQDPQLRSAIVEVLGRRVSTSALIVLSGDSDAPEVLNQAQAAFANICLIDVNDLSAVAWL